MRSSTIIALFALFLTAGLFANTARAQAADNERIRFQGRLLDSSGNPVTTPTSVEFNLYTTVTGGTSVWSETHNVAPSGNGIFSIELGDQTDFTGVDFSQALYLGVTPDTDSEMTPRYLFTASSVAHYAKDAGSLGGLTSGDFAQLGAANVNFTGSVSAGSFSGDGSGLTSLNAATLTGALPALNGSALTSLDASALTGTLPALDGSNLTGITSAQITGLGSMATQDASSVSITGGSLDDTTIGGGTPAAGSFTTLTGGATTLNSSGTTLTVATTGTLALDVIGPTNIAGPLDVSAPITTTAPITTGGPVYITSTAPVVFNQGSASASNLVSAATSGQTWTLPDQSGLIALTSDITGGTQSGNFASLNVVGTGSFGGLLTASEGLSASLTATGVPTTPVVGGHVTTSSDGTETYGALGEATYTGTAVGTGEQIIGSHGLAHISNSGAGILAIGTGGQSTEVQLGDNLGVHAWARQGGRNTGLMAVANADFTQQTTWATGLPADLTVAVLGFNNEVGANDYGLYVEGANNRIVGDLDVTGTISGSFSGTISNADQLDNLDSTDFAILANATNTFTGDITANSFSGDGAGLTNLTAANVTGTLTDAQVDNNLAIDGGSINSTIIGGTTAAAGTFTDLTVTATGTVTLPANSIADGALSGNVTLAGNTFNGASQLVQLDTATALPAVDGSNLTNVDAATLQGNVAADFAAAIHAHDAGDITSGVFLDARIAASNVTQHQGALSIANTQITGLGTMSIQNASSVAITGGSGDFTSLTSAGGFTSTGGESSFTAPLTTPTATYTAHDFVADVDGNTTNTSRALRALMTGTNSGAAEVTGAWLEASGDGDITQGVFGQSVYTGAGGGTSIGLDGRARIFTATTPHLAIGTAGRADDTQGGSNIGVHAWARNGGKSAGLMAVANATEAEQNTFDGTLPASLTAAVLGFNNATGVDAFGLHVTGENNFIDGDLEVTGTINASISGTAADSNQLQGATWDAPLAIGGTTAAAGTFTDLTAAGIVTLPTNSIADGALSGNVTLQGNTFNGISELVQLDAAGALPALDGANLTGVDAATLGGNNAAFFQDATNINAGTLNDLRLSANVTLQGNTFNGASQLVQLDGTAALPVLDGANLTSLTAGNITGTLTDAQVDNNLTIDGGSVNNTIIGGTTAAAGTFTSLTVNTSLVRSMEEITAPAATISAGIAVIADDATGTSNHDPALPTGVATGHTITVINEDADPATVNGVSIPSGQSRTFVFDGTNWR